MTLETLHQDWIQSHRKHWEKSRWSYELYLCYLSQRKERDYGYFWLYFFFFFNFSRTTKWKQLSATYHLSHKKWALSILEEDVSFHYLDTFCIWDSTGGKPFTERPSRSDRSSNPLRRPGNDLDKVSGARLLPTLVSGQTQYHSSICARVRTASRNLSQIEDLGYCLPVLLGQQVLDAGSSECCESIWHWIIFQIVPFYIFICTLSLRTPYSVWVELLFTYFLA